MIKKLNIEKRIVASMGLVLSGALASLIGLATIQPAKEMSLATEMRYKAMDTLASKATEVAKGEDGFMSGEEGQELLDALRINYRLRDKQKVKLAYEYPSVFAITNSQKGDGEFLFYVGQTNDLRAIKDYLRTKWEK